MRIQTDPAPNMGGLTELSCARFVEQLASAAPTPGGGGASALCGALAMALGNMVGNLTVGKPKYAAAEQELRACMQHGDALCQRLLGLVERDAEAFAPLARAYGLPRDTDEQRATREKVMQAALCEAASVPAEILAACEEAATLIEAYALRGAAIAVSDAGAAAALCEAAAKSAALNVYINTKSMKDRVRAEALNQNTQRAASAVCEKAGRVYAAVKAGLEV